MAPSSRFKTLRSASSGRSGSTGSDSHGWGFGLAVVTRRDDVAATPGRFGWDGGLGTSWYSDPREEMVGILLTQRAWTSPKPPSVCLDFWTCVYQGSGLTIRHERREMV